MNRGFWLALWLVVGGLAGQEVEAQEGPTVEERLIRLEEGQKGLAQRIDDSNRRIDDSNRRIDDLRTDTNKRFEELRADMNKRFEELRADMNKRFDSLSFWLQLLLGGVFATLGMLVVQWVLMVRRMDRVETRVNEHLAETEKDRLLVFQREAVEALRSRLERLEQVEQRE